MKGSMFLVFLVTSFSIFGQITFNEIVEAARNPTTDQFQRNLRSNGFFPNKIEKTFESWGYGLEAERALFWVHIQKSDNSSITDIQIISWGHEIHAQLVDAIVKNCKYRGARRHYEGTYYQSYLHEELLEIGIWNGDKDGIDYSIIDIYFTDEEKH